MRLNRVAPERFDASHWMADRLTVTLVATIVVGPQKKPAKPGPYRSRERTKPHRTGQVADHRPTGRASEMSAMVACFDLCCLNRPLLVRKADLQHFALALSTGRRRRSADRAHPYRTLGVILYRGQLALFGAIFITFPVIAANFTCWSFRRFTAVSAGHLCLF